MLGVRLSPEIENSLDRYARQVGRSKSVIVRDWIVERLERGSIDAQLRYAAHVLAVHDRPEGDIDGDLDD
jgi:predicted DNA-binding protein